MEDTYWLPQTVDKALFDDILWSKPEQKNQAGKLALIGGNSHGFNSVSEAYNSAVKAGVGVIRTFLPDSLSKTVSWIWPECEYSPSTKIGSFSSKSLNDWLALSDWADGVLISGDLTHNSETAILLERYLINSAVQLTLSGDAVDIINESPQQILDKNNLTLACEIAQLQKLLIGIRYPTAVKSTMALRQLVDLLHSLTLNYPFAVITTHDGQAYVALAGKVSTTPIKTASVCQAAAAATVWSLQHPAKKFDALTTAMFEIAIN